MPSIYRYASILAILRMALQFPHLISPFPAIASNSDCSPKSPMPIHQPIHSTHSSANLEQRLMQVGCIILLASIMESMCVSISLTSLANHSGSIMLSIYYEQRQRHRQRSYTKQAVTLARHRVVRNLLFAGGWTPLPLYPMHPCVAAPNAETPLPIKTAILYVNIVY